MAQQVVSGIDLGNQVIRVLIASPDVEGRNLTVLGTGVCESQGLRKGSIVDADEFVHALTIAIEQAERMSGVPVEEAVVGVNGTHVQAFNARGVVAVSRGDGDITPEDVDRVLQSAQETSIPHNHSILEIVPREFAVDDRAEIKDPVGMTGIRLEVDAHIITGLESSVRQIEKCLGSIGVEVLDLVPHAIAASEIVLNRSQKEVGVCLLDIGSSTTAMLVMEEGVLLHSAVLPIGASHITNDLAIGLRSTIDVAELVKLQYGHARARGVNTKEQIDLSILTKESERHMVSKHYIAQIIEARVHELLLMAKDHLSQIGRDGRLPGGVVLTGGGSKLPDLTDMVKDTLGLPAQIGFPINLHGMTERVDDPEFAVACGLAKIGLRTPKKSFGLSKLGISSMSISIKDMFSLFKKK